MRLVGDGTVEGELVAGGEGEAGVVGVAVHVIRLDPVASLTDREIEPRFHDCQDARRPDIQPALVGKTAQGVPQIQQSEARCVRPKVLV